MDSIRFELYARIAVTALLVIGCFLVLRPFLGAVLLAIILCLSTWPGFRWLRDRWGGRSSLAAAAFVLGLLLVIALPVALAAHSLIVYSGQIVEAVRGFLDRGSTIELPQFIRDLPWAGPAIDAYWHKILESREELVALARKLAEPAKTVLFGLGGAIGEGLFQILIAIFVSFFFYRDGDRAVELLRTGVGRLAGIEQGAALVTTAQNAVMAVVYGLIGTAVAQAFVALVGFLIAGVPGAFLLAALTFLLSLIPMGPVLVWGGAAGWLYYGGETGWAIFMVIYGIAVISSVDNFVKPILMARVGGLPMLLVVLGVFGGAVAFGFIGLFVGPALLSVAWSLTRAWLDAHGTPEEPSGPGAGTPA